MALHQIRWPNSTVIVNRCEHPLAALHTMHARQLHQTRRLVSTDQPSSPLQGSMHLSHPAHRITPAVNLTNHLRECLITDRTV